jgi:putative transposase
MARKKGQTYTAQQKTNIVLECLKEEKTLNELATEYKITPKTIQNWKKQFLDNASIAMEPAKAVTEYSTTFKTKI